MKKISPLFAGISSIAICILLIATHTEVKAKSPTADNTGQHNQGTGRPDVNAGRTLSFLENKGQVQDQYGQPRTDIQFSIAAANGLNIFIGDGAIHYQFNKAINAATAKQGNNDGLWTQPFADGQIKLPETVSYDMHRLDVALVGANRHAQVITEQRQAYFEKYFKSGMGEGGATACAWNRITYKEVYPNIDWVLYINEGKLKHEFVVHKGGRVADIQLKYGGATSLQVDDNGALTANTAQGVITEQAPYSYTNDGKKVGSKFILKGDLLSYQTNNYNGELVIDPTLEWSRVFGGSYENVFSVKVDTVQNVYVTGATTSPYAIATVGAYQTVFMGDVDAYLVKYNSAGTEQWATYYGGSAVDVGASSAVDNEGYVYVGGITKSTSGLATTGAHQTTMTGGSNAFIVKFNGNGERQWATYYGGSSFDVGSSIAVDKSNNVYICGGANSSSGIATAGAYQTIGGGGFFAKFNKYGVRQWGSYYPALNMRMAVDDTGNIYMTGRTGSALGIATTGAHKTTLSVADGYDAIITKFDSNGNRIWGTYYGAEGYDEGRSIAVSKTGDVYICGMTRSASGIASPGSYQDTYHGVDSGSAFFARFNNVGDYQWGTYYGLMPNESFAICTDEADGIYVTGVASAGMATDDAYLTAGDDAYLSFGRCFVAQFDSSGSRKWSTHYNADYIFSVTVDRSANLYVASVLAGLQHLARFNANRGRVAVCVGSTTTFSNPVSGGVWSSSNSAVATIGATTGLLTGLTVGTTRISYLISGQYVVSTVTVNSAVPSFASTLTPPSVCSGSVFNYPFSGTVFASTYMWTRSGVTGITNPAATGYNNPNETLVNSTSSPIAVVYVYTLTAGGCMNVKNVTVTVNPSPSAISGPSFICAGTTATCSNLATGGLWSASNTRVAIGSTTGVVTGISAGTANITYSLSDGCKKSVTVTVGALPSVGSIAGTTTICYGSSVTLTNTATGGTWISTDTGVAAIGSSTGIVTGVNSGTSNVTYTVTGSNGCTNYNAKTVTVISLPSVPAISAGSGALCQNATLVLTESTVGGSHTWSSGNLAVASINASNGTVKGLSPGTAIITYNYTLGCSNRTTTIITVNAVVVPTITGTAIVCSGQTSASLAGEPTGGVWNSSAPTIAAINSTSGIVTGVAAGTARITYTYTNEFGCIGKNYSITTVNASPAVSAITGSATICAGATATLTDATSGGSWSSITSAATIDGASGSITGIAAGTTIISYTVTGANGCIRAVQKAITVNALPTVPAITGGSVALCAGTTLPLTETTTGGTHLWTSDNTLTATVNSGTGVVTGVAGGIVTISYKYTLGCINYATTTLTVNPQTTVAITGTPTVCVNSNITLYGDPSGGTWSSSAPTKAAIDAGSGVITGIATGTATITYTRTNEFGCVSKANVNATVKGLPGVGNIGGISTLCNGATGVVTDATAGGSWSSSNPGVASIDSSGLLTASSAGTTLITYSVTGTNGCTASKNKTVTVNALPSVPAIDAGAGMVCQGAALALTESTSGGTHLWSSDNTAVATINSSTGVLTGVAPGTVTISYRYTLGCTNYTTTNITVNPAVTVDVISGPTSVVAGSTITLENTIPGGAWTSSNTAKATVGSGSGIVNGISAGTANITYTVTGCGTARAIQMITISAARPAASDIAPVSASAISIFPNPTTGTFTLQSEGDGVLTVYTLEGKTVTQYNTYSGNNVLSLPYNIAAGVYLCRYAGNDGSVAVVRLVYGN